MKYGLRGIGATGLSSGLLAFAVAAQSGPGSAPIAGSEAGWAAMKQCASIPDDARRHACADDVLRRAGLLGDAETLAAERTRRFGLPEPAAKATQPASTTPGAAKKDRVEVTLASVEDPGNGKLILTTTDGAVWRQVESQAIRPMPEKGQTMVVEEASLGSFMCRPSKWVSFRCYRAR